MLTCEEPAAEAGGGCGEGGQGDRAGQDGEREGGAAGGAHRVPPRRLLTPVLPKRGRIRCSRRHTFSRDLSPSAPSARRRRPPGGSSRRGRPGRGVPNGRWPRPRAARRRGRPTAAIALPRPIPPTGRRRTRDHDRPQAQQSTHARLATARVASGRSTEPSSTPRLTSAAVPRPAATAAGRTPAGDGRHPSARPRPPSTASWTASTAATASTRPTTSPPGPSGVVDNRRRTPDRRRTPSRWPAR